MNHGDIICQIEFFGEPSALFRIFRSTLQSARPTSAIVSVLKRNVSPQIFSTGDAAATFKAVTNSERKLADITLSAKAGSLEPTEISDSRLLIDLLWKWLSGRTQGATPVLDEEMLFMRVRISAEGKADEVMSEIELVRNIEFLDSIAFKPAFLQGNPRVVKSRQCLKLPQISEVSAMKDNVEIFAQLLADGQKEHLFTLCRRVESMFINRKERRDQVLERRAKQVFGDAAKGWRERIRSNTWSGHIREAENYAFEGNMNALERANRMRVGRQRIRVWRAA